MTNLSEKAGVLGRIFWKKQKQHRNCIFIIHGEGQTGIGKSYMALSFGEKYDPFFGVNHIVFESDEFISICQNLPPKSIIIYDDAGADIDCRKFMDAVNLAIRHTLEMFRKKELTVIFTVPHLSQLEQTAKIMSDAIVWVVDRGLAKVYKYRKSSFDGHEYTSLLAWLGNPDDPNRRIPMPLNQRLIDDYERKKDEAILRQMQLSQCEVVAAKEAKKRKFTAKQIAEEIIRESRVDEYINEKGKYDVSLLAGDFNIGTGKGYQVTAQINKLLNQE